MINNVILNISVDLIGLSDEKLCKIINKIINKFNDNNGKINFKELDEIFLLSHRPYHINSYNLPDFNRDENTLIKETEINITG